MCADGVVRDAQATGSLIVGQSGGGEFGHLELARRRFRPVRPRASAHIVLLC